MAARSSALRPSDDSIFGQLSRSIHRPTTTEAFIRDSLAGFSPETKELIYHGMTLLGKRLSIPGADVDGFGERFVTTNPLDPLTIKVWGIVNRHVTASSGFLREIDTVYPSSFYTSGRHALLKLYMRSLHDVTSESLYADFSALSEGVQNSIRAKVYELAKEAGLETDKPYFDFGRSFISRENMHHTLVKKAIRDVLSPPLTARTAPVGRRFSV